MTIFIQGRPFGRVGNSDSRPEIQVNIKRRYSWSSRIKQRTDGFQGIPLQPGVHIDEDLRLLSLLVAFGDELAAGGASVIVLFPHMVVRRDSLYSFLVFAARY